MNEVEQAKQAVVKLAAELSHKGWLPATSGNLSVRVAGTDDFCITPSGVDKGFIKTDEVLWVNKDGLPREDSPYHPSAETIVHQYLYHADDCGCVLHVHTMFNNMISEVYFNSGHVGFTGHELLKALGHWEEDASIEVPIVENFANLTVLGPAVGEAITAGVPAVLVHNHGIYAFGQGPNEAKRHLEALEFLFEYRIRMLQLTGGRK